VKSEKTKGQDVKVKVRWQNCGSAFSLKIIPLINLKFERRILKILI